MDVDHSNDGIVMADRYLPKEVMCRILARLPVRSFIRLRSVCKRWHSLVEDPEFRNHWKIFWPPAKVPILLWHPLGESEHILALDAAKEWQHFPTSIFLPLVQDPTNVSLTVLSSTRGLFLVRQRRVDPKFENETFFIINPLTRSVRQIPPMIDHRDYSIRQMIMIDEQENRYVIIAEDLNLVSSGHTESKLQMYDSRQSSWAMIGELPYCLRFKSAAYVKGSLYCLATFTTAHVFRFDGAQNWEEVKAKVPLCTGSQLLRCVPSLFQHRGQLILVGLGDSNRARWQREAGVREWLEAWQLDEMRSNWVQVQGFCSPWVLNQTKDLKHHFLSSGDLLFLITVGGCEQKVEVERTICNLRTGSSWRDLLPTPKNSCPVSPVAVNIFNGFCMYEPRIEAEA